MSCVCGFRDERPGVGDRLAMGLSVIGITEERYKALKARAGLKADCLCGKRQQAVNKMFGKG